MPRIVPSQAVPLIDRLFPHCRAENPSNVHSLTGASDSQVVAMLEIVQQVPSELINLDHDDYVEFISSIAALRYMTEVWKTDQGAYFGIIPGLRPLSPVTLLRQALAKCPDEFPSSGVSELSFIGDDELRERLRLDIGTVESAFSNGEWKAATVLAGSVIEALLLWVLLEQNPANVSAAAAKLNLRVPSNPEEWVLYQFIEIAGELKLIGTETAMQCRLAKDYRNLIHPGRAQRLGQACNRGTALSAVAAVEHVVNDLGAQDKKFSYGGLSQAAT